MTCVEKFQNSRFKALEEDWHSCKSGKKSTKNSRLNALNMSGKEDEVSWKIQQGIRDLSFEMGLDIL